MIHITRQDGKIVSVSRETVIMEGYGQIFYGDEKVYDGDFELTAEYLLTPGQAVAAVEKQELQSLRIDRGTFASERGDK